VQQFLTDLAEKQSVSASTQNQALNALVFLYREVLRKRPYLKKEWCIRVVDNPGNSGFVVGEIAGRRALCKVPLLWKPWKDAGSHRSLEKSR